MYYGTLLFLIRFLWFLFFPFSSQGQGRTERPKLKATKGKMRETEIERKGE
jgi:hypothetical protein